MICDKNKKNIYIYKLFCRGVFKTKATKLETALKAAGFDVIVNETKPRKGTFSVKLDGTETAVVELVSMARPFKKLRELDIDQLGEDMIKKYL